MTVSATYSSVGDYALMYDGQYIWVSSGTNVIKVIDPNDGSVQQTITLTGTINKIVFDGTNAWAAVSGGSYPLYKITVSTYTAAGITLTGITSGYGMCFDGDYLWIGTRTGVSYAKVLASTSAVTVVPLIGFYTNGMVFDGKDVWSGNYVLAGTAYAIMNLATTTTYDSASTQYVFHIAFDGERLWYEEGGSIKAFNINTRTQETTRTTLSGGASAGAMAFDGQALYVGSNTILKRIVH